MIDTDLLEEERFACPPTREFMVQITIASIEEGKPKFCEDEPLELINEPFFL